MLSQVYGVACAVLQPPALGSDAGKLRGGSRDRPRSGSRRKQRTGVDDDVRSERRDSFMDAFERSDAGDGAHSVGYAGGGAAKSFSDAVMVATRGPDPSRFAALEGGASSANLTADALQVCVLCSSERYCVVFACVIDCVVAVDFAPHS
jgi:hypothetical protein